VPEAVLIRSVQMLDNINAVTNGPGKLCAFFGLSKEHDGRSYFSPDSDLWLEADNWQPTRILKTPRIGVQYAGEAAQWPLRFLHSMAS
jgi:DNA-3-methyladenine glycosylase